MTQIETYAMGYDNYRERLYRTCGHTESKARTTKARRKLLKIERNIENIDMLFWQMMNRLEELGIE